MKIQKRHWIIIFSVIAFIVGIEVLQYGRTLRENIVAAVQTIPNPGHSWAEMESGPDSIQVSGRTITNLTAPVASTDATNKEYVDAASSGGTFEHCYIIRNKTTAATCAIGYTAVARGETSQGSWAFNSPFVNGVGNYLTLGSGILAAKFEGISSLSDIKYNDESKSWYCSDGGTVCGGANLAVYGALTLRMTLNGVVYDSFPFGLSYVPTGNTAGCCSDIISQYSTACYAYSSNCAPAAGIALCCK